MGDETKIAQESASRASKKDPMMPDERRSAGRARPGVVVPVCEPRSSMPLEYGALLAEFKGRIGQARLRITMAANSGMVLLYWELGWLILQRQSLEGWGAKVIDRLSSDLRIAFPEMKGLSPRNLKYMRAFAEAWPDGAIVQRTIAQLPWRQNLALLDKLDSSSERLWYAQRCLEHGWSQPILSLQIQAKAHLRVGQAQNNFQQTLPPEKSDLAVQVFKDPYLFDFLGTDAPRREAELEQSLMEHVEKFLLELGAGFALVGRQVRLEVGGSDYRTDLLFYHIRLHCYVVIELKAGAFEPGHMGQIGFYQAVVDDTLRQPEDQPTIGLLLVSEKNRVLAEYCLSGNKRPVGIAEWTNRLTRTLPDKFRGSLPTIEEIEGELSGADDESAGAAKAGRRGKRGKE